MGGARPPQRALPPWTAVRGGHRGYTARARVGISHRSAMAAPAAVIPSPSDAAPAPRRGFLAWYRRYYLLVNLPLLMLILELVLVRVDLVHRWPFNEKDDLAKAFASY